MPGTDALAPAPTHRRLDIRRVFVRHTAHVVAIRAVMRALTRPEGDESYGVSGYIKVNRQAQPSESVAWQWAAYFDDDHRRHGSHMWVVDAAYQEQYGCDGRDEGLNATAHYNGNWVTMIIPRRCLAFRDTNVRPRWVRVSVATSYTIEPDRRSYFDRLRAQVPDPWPDFLNVANSHFTPRLYAG